jgi:hypothetical protein
MIFDGQAADPRPAVQALDVWLTDLDHLQKIVDGGGLDGLSNHERVAYLQALERGRNKMASLDHVIIAEAIAHDLPGELGQSSMTRVLTQALRISVGEASRRVQAAEQLGDRVSMLGQRMGPIRPVLAAAQRRGDVSPEQVHIIQRGLASVDRAGFDPAEIATGEQILTRAALDVGPKDLQGLTDRVVEAINPDGTRPIEELNQERRFFHLRPTSDGMYRGRSGSPAPWARNCRRCSVRWRNPGSTRPPATRWIRGPMGSGSMTASKTPATGSSGPARCPTPAAPPPP